MGWVPGATSGRGKRAAARTRGAERGDPAGGKGKPAGAEAAGRCFEQCSPSLTLLSVKAAVRGPSGEEVVEEGCAGRAVGLHLSRVSTVSRSLPSVALWPAARLGSAHTRSSGSAWWEGTELSAVAGTEPQAQNPSPASRSCQEQVPSGGERGGSCGKVRRELAGLQSLWAGHGAPSAFSSVGRVMSP